MQITIDTSLPLNEREVAILRGLLDDEPATPAQEPKKRTRKAAEPAPAAQAPEPAPEPEEDLIGAEAPTVTKSEMVALASKLVSSGETAKVKAALQKVGAGRVTQIESPEDIATVYQELSA